MSGIFATAGAKLYIGDVLAPKTTNFVSSDFTSQSWQEIGWVENLGQFGDESAAINFDAIKNARTHKLKGQRNAGDMAVVMGVDYADIGQSAIREAQATDYNYAFKVEFDDMPSGGSTNSFRYFIALVMSMREVMDAANNVVKMNATLAINSNVVKVDAT